MNKYIDAEKLIAEIEGIIAAVKANNHPDKLGTIKQCMVAAEIEALNLALDCIKELQQEQPKMDFEDKFAKFLERKDTELGVNSWSEEDLRELAMYFYFDKNNNKQQEVDLEKEMEEYLGENWKDGTPIEVQDDMIKFARHFFELGKNARK